jgi:hypothetical protein
MPKFLRGRGCGAVDLLVVLSLRTSDVVGAGVERGAVLKVHDDCFAVVMRIAFG